MGQVPTVGLLGTPGSVLRAMEGTSCALSKVGMNTGNLMFQYSFAKNVLNPTVFLENGGDRPLAEFKDSIDVLCIPAANQLNPQWDLEWWARLIEDLDKPVIIAGLGAQAKINEVHRIDLAPGTLRFVDLLRERAPFIGVRGEATQRLLQGLGVDNVKVSGCPSNFISRTITGDHIAQKLKGLKDVASPRINLLTGTLEDYTRATERHLFRLSLKHRGKIIYQTNPQMLAFITRTGVDRSVRRYLAWEANLLQSGLTEGEYRQMIRRRGRYFFSAPAWIDDVSGDDLSIGQRIHGAVAAIQGGSLGVCVAFDSRTLELARTMGYPYIRAEDVMQIEDLRDIEPMVHFEAEQFDVKRRQLCAAMRECTEHFGVRTTFHMDT